MKKILDTLIGYINPKYKGVEETHKISASLHDTMVILPESVRYAMQYKNALLGKEEIQSLLHPSFGIVGLYIMTKYYADDIESVRYILHTYLIYKDDYSVLYKKLLEYHLLHGKDNLIDGSKIAVLGKYGFKALDKKFDEIVEDINQKGLIPICLLYSGILSLPSFINKFSGSEFFLFDLKHPENSFLCKKHGQIWLIEQNTIQHIIGKKYVLVDDVLHTGKSYEKAKSILSEYGFDENIDILVPVRI